MRIAVVSCAKYADCWLPFFSLLRKFWPTCNYPIWLLTDVIPAFDFTGKVFEGVNVRAYGKDVSWCGIIAKFAAETDGLSMIFQDDFWINATVNELLVEKGIDELIERKAAMVRLYPCPGGDIPYGNKWYAEIPKGQSYRVSCQLSVWENEALFDIANNCSTPSDFEIRGSKLSNYFDEPFLAFRRDQQPYPVNYFCSAVSRSKFEPAALEFCRANGIEVDTSMREVA